MVTSIDACCLPGPPSLFLVVLYCSLMTLTFIRKNDNYNYARTNHQNDGNSAELYIALAMLIAYNAYFILCYDGKTR